MFKCNNIVTNNSYGDSPTPLFAKCATIIGYVASAIIIKWRLTLKDGTIIYESENYLKCETWKLDLSTLEIYPGTICKLQAYTTTTPSYPDVFIEYNPDDKATSYFKVDSSGTEPDIHYFGTVTESLKCSSIYVYNNSFTVTRFAVSTLDWKYIFVSSKCRRSHGLTIHLSDAGVATGALLKVKAVVTGSDSVANITLQYDPTSTNTAHFQLIGNPSITMLMYTGL